MATLPKILIDQKLKETGFAPSQCLSRFSRLSCGVCWMNGQEMLVYCHGGERFHYLLKPDNKQNLKFIKDDYWVSGRI